MIIPKTIILIITVLIIGIMGCGSDGSNSSNSGDGTDLPEDAISGVGEPGGAPALDFVSVEGGSVSREMSALTGGTMTAGSVRLEIPSGALPDDTMVTMTILRDTSMSDYAFLGMFEPDGLALNKPATLVINLDAPLPVGMDLNLLSVDSSDPDEFIDTGLTATISDDRTEVRISIDHFSGRGCADLNCHGHSLRKIIQALLAQGMTKESIVRKIRDTVGEDRLNIPAEDDTETGLTSLQRLETHYDRLNETERCLIRKDELLSYLNTFYTLATVRIDADDQGDRLAPDGSCLENLEVLAKSSDLPPILNFGTAYTVNNTPDTNISSEQNPVFFDSLPHSTPVVVRGDNVVFENGLSLSAKRDRELEDARRNHPDGSGEMRRVAAVDLRDLDRFRKLKSGEALLEEFRKWDPNKQINTGSSAPWAAVRIWVPKGKNPGLCDPQEQNVKKYYVFKTSGTGYRKKWGGWADKMTGYDYSYQYIFPSEVQSVKDQLSQFDAFTASNCERGPAICPCPPYPDIWVSGNVEVFGPFDTLEELDPYRCDNPHNSGATLICNMWDLESAQGSQFWDPINSICNE
ncbi:MAG: hypothetical protein C4522_13850 [Desulfobacteraceae bacterium]|nr:MAG: hypothetical protein C4522_13850 [Desulfobacteraceae bacterium]